MSKIPQRVIIGAGFGGLAAACKLAGKQVRVTLIDRQNHHLFQPLLYQLATAAVDASTIEKTGTCAEYLQPGIGGV